MIPVPEPINWILAVAGLASIFVVVKEKWPLFREKLRSTDGHETRSARDYLFGSLAALCCACLWAASYASLSYVRRTATELQVVMYQFGFAAVFLYLASLAERRVSGNSDKKHADLSSARMALLVLFNIGNFTLSIWALSFISASQAMTLNNLSPLFVAAYLFARGRLNVSTGTFLSLFLVSIGALLVSTDGSGVPGVPPNFAGLLIAIAAGISFALWTVATEKSGQNVGVAGRFRLLARIFFYSFVAAIAIAYFGDSRPSLSVFSWLVLALNGLRVACVYFLFDVAIRRAGPLLASIVVVLQVPLTFPFDYWFNNALLTPSLILGAFLIVFAAAALLIDEVRQPPSGTPVAEPAP